MKVFLYLVLFIYIGSIYFKYYLAIVKALIFNEVDGGRWNFDFDNILSFTVMCYDEINPFGDWKLLLYALEFFVELLPHVALIKFIKLICWR